MRRVFAVFVLVGLLAGIVTSSALAQPFPAPRGFVNDFAFMLSSDTRIQLERRLATLERETTAEVAVVTVDSLDGDSIEDYADALFQAWDIGKKDKDNGVLFLISLEPRSLRIEVGYGLEPIITDGRAGRILDDEVIPYLREGDYDSGVEAGVTAIEGYIRDGTPPSIAEENPIQNILSRFKLPLWLLITLGVLTVYILGFMARTRSIWLGGIWGLILGVILGFGFGGISWIILLPMGMGFFGLLLDIVLSANYRGRSSSGMSTGWISSMGGFRGSGGGGFGGFGGGSSGGGGASRGF